jgi:hypothetical protein
MTTVPLAGSDQNMPDMPDPTVGLERMIEIIPIEKKDDVFPPWYNCWCSECSDCCCFYCARQRSAVFNKMDRMKQCFNFWRLLSVLFPLIGGFIGTIFGALVAWIPSLVYLGYIQTVITGLIVLIVGISVRFLPLFLSEVRVYASTEYVKNKYEVYLGKLLLNPRDNPPHSFLHPSPSPLLVSPVPSSVITHIPADSTAITITQPDTQPLIAAQQHITADNTTTSVTVTPRETPHLPVAQTTTGANILVAFPVPLPSPVTLILTTEPPQPQLISSMPHSHSDSALSSSSSK